MDEGGNARITDFGLASITRDPSSVQSTISDSGYTQRWAAPEVFGGESIASKQSDIFSFGMVILEVGGSLISKGSTASCSKSRFFPGKFLSMGERLRRRLGLL